MTQSSQINSGLLSTDTGYQGVIGDQVDQPVPVSLTWAVSNILTVGVGEEFSTIAAAVSAARNGDIMRTERRLSAKQR